MSVRPAVEAVFREEYGRIIAALIRISGSFDRAEEAMQDALASALVSWPAQGVPRNPGAWIMSAAHRKLIDRSRRDRTQRDKEDAVRYEIEARSSQDYNDEEFMRMLAWDDRLRLMFTCCHPALPREGQVALTLRMLGGLTTTEIAKAFLLPEPTLAQRLVRVKRKIQDAGIPYQVPRPEQLIERLYAVQAVIYLIFNEGYAASSGDELVRRDLCVEAIRLARLLCDLAPDDSESIGLLALMVLHHSRRDGRVCDGQLVTLEEQDRLLWKRVEIAEGSALVERALRRGRIGPYQLQAAIAALHAQPLAAADTDWPQIAALYERLLVLQPTPVVRLNHAVAVAMAGSFAEGLRLIDAAGADGRLDRYYLFHAARADVFRRMGQHSEEAAAAYRKAIELVANALERQFLERRLTEVTSRDAHEIV
jgi:RNA polymerase sigma-70 factor (ECF subfamily)